MKDTHPSGDSSLGQPRIVVDTVGYLRVVLKDRGPWAALFRDYFDQVLVLISDPIKIEILDVLSRPGVRRRFPETSHVGRSIVQRVLDSAIHVELGEIPRVCRDPNDDVVLATALAGNADFIATEDKDLLDLGEHRGIPIITGRELLEILGRVD